MAEVLVERTEPNGIMNPATPASVAICRVASIVTRHPRFGRTAEPRVDIEPDASHDEAVAVIYLPRLVGKHVLNASFRIKLKRDVARWLVGINDGPIQSVLDLADWSSVSKVVDEARKEFVK